MSFSLILVFVGTLTPVEVILAVNGCSNKELFV